MANQFRFRSLRAVVALVAVTTAGTLNAQQSLENFSFHGSVTAAYAKSDGLGVLGIPKEGTFDYNLIAMQFGYKFDANNRVVVQLLHRSLGTSPLKPLMPELSPVWAFFETKAAGFTIKLGRDPLPRGIFNEVRFIGTLLPLFREATYGETLENIDGIVVSRTFDLGHNWGFDANAMGGEFDIKYVLPTATGAMVGNIRGKNSLGTQLWLNTPLKGLRFGTFVNRFDLGKATVQQPTAQAPTLAKMLSVDGDFSRVIARGEFFSVTAGSGPARTDYSSWYAQGGVKLTDKLTVLGEYNSASSLINPAPLPEIKLNLNKDYAAAVNYSPSANVKYKFELHRADGYSFDTAVPTLVPPTKAPFVMTPAPRSKANYAILSVSVSF